MARSRRMCGAPARGSPQSALFLCRPPLVVDSGAGTSLALTGRAKGLVHSELKHNRQFEQVVILNEAAKDLLERAAKLDVEMLCPQHGAIYRGRDVQRFINWFAEPPVGVLRAEL